MKLYCTAVVIPEFSDVAGKTAVFIQKRMNDAYGGQDFGGGLDAFTICLYVTYFEASSTLEEARLNHGIEVFQDSRTKKIMKGLGIIVVVDPDLAGNMTEKISGVMLLIKFLMYLIILISVFHWNLILKIFLVL